MSLRDDINNRIVRLLTDNEKIIAERLTNGEKELLNAYSEALKQIKSDIALMYEKYGEKVSYADMVAYQRLTNLEKKIIEQIKLLNKSSIQTTEAHLKEAMEQGFYRSGFAHETSLGVRLGFGLLDPNVVTASILNPLMRISWKETSGKIAEGYLNRIRTELTQGLIQGKGYVNIANKLNDITEKNAYERLRIIRTEGHRIQSTGRHLAFEKSKAAADRLGIEIVNTWVHSGNRREPRPDHVEMNGVEADEEDIFSLPDGTKTVEPGMTGVAEHDINCGCTSATKIKSLNENLPIDNKIKNASYDQWAEMKGIPN